MPDASHAPERMQIIGHRGARGPEPGTEGYEPENTLRSIRRALELNVDMVECDVTAVISRKRKKRMLIGMHDHTLDRTTNGSGLVVETSFEKLRTLNAGWDEYEQIPTAEEATETVNRRVPLVFDFKNLESAELLAEMISRYIELGWEYGDFRVMSYHEPGLKTFKKLIPDVDIIALMYGERMGGAGFAQDMHAKAVAQATEFVTEAFVRDAHDRGLDAIVYTSEPVDAKRVKWMDSIGVDAFISDTPDVHLKLLVPEKQAA
jgi:glycerophosphoryl diester phosphodiesterase